MTFTMDIPFSPSVKAVQARLGSRETYERMATRGGFKSAITPELGEFLGRLDAFFLATSSADGQPYVQHRGGPPGFLRVLDDQTLAFVDYTGNRQYVSYGNLAENDRVCLFLLEHQTRKRVKVWGRARVVDDDPALLERLRDPDYEAQMVAAVVIDVEAWDINCPQHIPRRHTDEQIAPVLEELQDRIAALEEENAGLRNQ